MCDLSHYNLIFIYYNKTLIYKCHSKLHTAKKKHLYKCHWKRWFIPLCWTHWDFKAGSAFSFRNTCIYQWNNSESQLCTHLWKKKLWLLLYWMSAVLTCPSQLINNTLEASWLSKLNTCKLWHRITTSPFLLSESLNECILTKLIRSTWDVTNSFLILHCPCRSLLLEKTRPNILNYDYKKQNKCNVSLTSGQSLSVKQKKMMTIASAHVDFIPAELLQSASKQSFSDQKQLPVESCWLHWSRWHLWEWRGLIYNVLSTELCSLP